MEFNCVLQGGIKNLHFLNFWTSPIYYFQLRFWTFDLFVNSFFDLAGTVTEQSYVTAENVVVRCSPTIMAGEVTVALADTSCASLLLLLPDSPQLFAESRRDSQQSTAKKHILAL